MISKREDRRTLPLFNDLFPFGGRLDEENRWVKLSKIVPWEEFESEYEKSLSKTHGRPAKDSRLVIGLLILKHTLCVGDREIVRQLSENIYFQYFCGYTSFQSKEQLEPTVLTHARRRISRLQFERFEQHLVRRLTELKLIRPKKVYVDATVYPVDMKYPTDVSLIEKARRTLVRIVDDLGKKIGKKCRTYKRKAKSAFTSFSKKKHKSRREIRKAIKQGLQFMRRNLRQAEDCIEKARKKGFALNEKVHEKIKVIRDLLNQQTEMYRKKIHRVKNRIVSLNREHIRPIIRGKNGKPTEFGHKASLSYVDNFCFLDRISADAFNESEDLIPQVERFKQRFGKYPNAVSADKIYGNRVNRRYLKNKNIRHSLMPLGRAVRSESPSQKRWRRLEQKRRGAWMEGIIGHSKNNFGLERIKAKNKNTEELWVKLAILAMNLDTAMKKI